MEGILWRKRRGINRVDYRVKSVIVTCDTFEKFYVDAINVSPLGMGLLAPAGTPNLVGRQIIIVAGYVNYECGCSETGKNGRWTIPVGN